MSSTAVLLEVAPEQEALFHDHEGSHPPKGHRRDSGDRRGSGADTSGAGCGLQGHASPPNSQEEEAGRGSQGHALPPNSLEEEDHDDSTRQNGESEPVDDGDGRYPESIEDFMATLLDGMRSDSVQLATSARNVVANTYQVGQVSEGYFLCGVHR